MNKTSTRNNLLLYAYNETDLIQSDSCQRLIDGDPVIAEEYNELVESINAMNEFVAEPSERVIARILAFAAS